jgi:intracellular sulfur oxidation DsrE/DsrF family protein
VNFEACETTLKHRGLKKGRFIQEAGFTPSGVVRLARFQGRGRARSKP